MKNICIIPARGGSVRIPRKNIRDFLGKPIISYSIEVALSSNLFNEVMVSTDDAEIASIAKSCGAQIPFMRSEKTSGDYATTFDVMEEVIISYRAQGKLFDNVCCIYPCAPFVSAESLKNSFSLLSQNSFDSIIPIVAYSFPIQRSLRVTNQKVSFFYPEFKDTRSQDLERAYHDVGQFYWAKVEKLMTSKSIITENSGSIVLNEMNVQDIDNEMDWQLAELKYKLSK